MSVRKKLYLLFGFQVIGFIGLFYLLYAYILPSIKQLERENKINTRLIKDVSQAQLLINQYFDGNVTYQAVQKKLNSILNTASKQKLLLEIRNIQKDIARIEGLIKRNSLLKKELFQTLDQSIKASNDYIIQVSYRLEDIVERIGVSKLERMVLRLAVVNTQTNNDIKMLFLELYSDIKKISELYKLIDTAINNDIKAKESLEGSPLVVLPMKAIEADKKAKEIIKEFEKNTKEKIQLENRVRKTFNKLVLYLSTTTKSVMSEIKRYVYLADIFMTIIALFSALLIYRIIKSMLTAISEFQTKLPKIAEGDLSYTLTLHNRDEFGQICGFFNDFISKLKENLRTIMQQQGEFISTSQQLANSTDAVTEISLNMIEEIKNISEDSSRIKNEAGKMVSNIEELRNMIEEINKKVVEMSKEIEKVTDTVQSTNSMMEHLNSSAKEVGNILKMINEITEQINLLALNATIEAARAGDTGRGFAVVANEIKDLANETAKATEFIKEKISAIQKNAEETFSKIAQVSTVVEEFVKSFDSITHISEEQRMNAENTYINVENTAQHLSKIDENISMLTKRIKEIEENIKDTKGFINKIGSMVKSTKNMIKQFKF